MRMLSAKQRTTTKWFAIGVILSAAALAATTDRRTMVVRRTSTLPSVGRRATYPEIDANRFARRGVSSAWTIVTTSTTGWRSPTRRRSGPHASWYASDGIHLSGTGAVAFATYLHRSLKKLGLTGPKPTN